MLHNLCTNKLDDRKEIIVLHLFHLRHLHLQKKERIKHHLTQNSGASHNHTDVSPDNSKSRITKKILLSGFVLHTFFKPFNPLYNENDDPNLRYFMAPTVALVTFSLELAPTFLPRLGHPIGLSFSHILGDSSMSLVLSLMKTITSQPTEPKENTSREQAVIAYTKTNAYAEFTEDQKGTLTKGKFADLAVLSQDIFTIPTEQLPATRSVLTLVDGKIVYEHPPMKTTEK